MPIPPYYKIRAIIRAVTSIKNDHPSTLSPNDRVFEYFEYCSVNLALTYEHCSNDKFQAQISLQIITTSKTDTDKVTVVASYALSDTVDSRERETEED